MWVDRELTSLRAEQEGFVSLSFETIAGFGEHGAIVHYEATEESDAAIAPNGLLLLDSGAHYDCGTTDITRTISVGEPTEEERRVYTLVLKGHLQLQAMHFPEGTTGLQLDTAARTAMWREGYDFGHGTGHGVGHVLGVHEGPAQIRKNYRKDTVKPIRAGHVITDEPGIYVKGKFGVRIENCLLCVAAQDTDFGRFLKFEPLTLCPYDRKLVVAEMLTCDERRWLNNYHERVKNALMPLLANEQEKAWLENATLAI
jgi:Xaa-Pro aminopeptidase